MSYEKLPASLVTPSAILTELLGNLSIDSSTKEIVRVSIHNFANQLLGSTAIGVAINEAATVSIGYRTSATLTTTATITLSGEQTIDGTLTSSSLVLVRHNGVNNGLYTTAAGAWTRVGAFNTIAELYRLAVYVTNGTSHARKTYYCNVAEDAVLGVDSIDFALISQDGDLFDITDEVVLARGGEASLSDAMNLKAPLASPTFTGVPAVPTAAPGTNTTQIASTAFVRAAITALVDTAPGTLDTLNELAAALGDDPNFATTMINSLAAKAPINSPTFTGSPAAPTQALGNRSTLLATTAFVQAELDTDRYSTRLDRALVAPTISKKMIWGVGFASKPAIGIRPLTGDFFVASQEPPRLNAVVRDDGNLYVSHKDVPANVVQFTYSGDAVPGSSWCDNKSVHFTRDLGTAILEDRMNAASILGSKSFMSTIGSDVTKVKVLLYNGQSVSVAGVQVLADVITTAAISNTRVLMPVGGVRPIQDYLPYLYVRDFNPAVNTNESLFRMPRDAVRRFVPLVERFFGNPTQSGWGETCCGGTGLEFFNERPSNEAIVLASLGVGATNHEEFDAYSDPMVDNMLITAEAIASYCKMINVEVEFIGVGLIHGEGAANRMAAGTLTKAQYKTFMVTLQSIMNTRLKEMSGQSRNVPLINSVPCSWTVAGNATNDLPIAMFEAVRENTDILATAPRYCLTHTADGIHLPGISSKILGQYFGHIAVARSDADTDTLDDEIDLYFTDVEADGLTLTCTASRSDLLFNTGTGLGEVSDPGQHGFRIIVDSGTVPTISDFNITDNVVTATLSTPVTAPQNPRLGVAEIGTPGAIAGPTTGPRSTLCSDTGRTGFDARDMHMYVQPHIVPITVI